MQNGILAALSGDRVIQSKLSVVVTEDCVVIPAFGGQPHTVLSLTSISAIKVVKTFHPGLLVISVALFLLAAAAASSKDGAGTSLPIGVLGLLFLIAFFASQKARVVFMIGSEATQTRNGTFADVADLIDAVEVTRRNMLALNSEKILVPGFMTRVRQWINGFLSPRIRTCVM